MSQFGFAVEGGGNGAERGGGEFSAQAFKTAALEASGWLHTWQNQGVTTFKEVDLDELDQAIIKADVHGVNERPIARGEPRDATYDFTTKMVQVYEPAWDLRAQDPIERAAFALHEILHTINDKGEFVIFHSTEDRDKFYEISSAFKLKLLNVLDIKSFRKDFDFQIRQFGGILTRQFRRNYQIELSHYKLMEATTDYQRCMNPPIVVKRLDTLGACLGVSAMMVVSDSIFELNELTAKKSADLLAVQRKIISELPKYQKQFGFDDDDFNKLKARAQTVIDSIEHPIAATVHSEADINAARALIQEYSDNIQYQARKIFVQKTISDLDSQYKNLVSETAGFYSNYQAGLKSQCPGGLYESLVCIFTKTFELAQNEWPTKLDEMAKNLEQSMQQSLATIQAYQEGSTP